MEDYGGGLGNAGLWKYRGQRIMVSDYRGHCLAGGEVPRTSEVSALTQNSSSHALPKAREDRGGRLKPEGPCGAGR